MVLRDSGLKLVNFFGYWYMRYLLVTELYIVEPWERAIMHILTAVFFLTLSYLNVQLANSLPVVLLYVNKAVS